MSIDKEMQDALDNFIIESAEIIESMEADLMILEQSDQPAETINAIFRAAHTLKGSSGLFGLGHIVSFTHVMENVLDRLREGKFSVSAELVAALLPCCDYLTVLFNEIAIGNLEILPDHKQAGDLLLQGLLPFLEQNATETHVVIQNQTDPIETLASSTTESGNWHLFIHLNQTCFQDGMDPLSFINYLSTLGEIVDLTTFSQAMPDADKMDPELSYLAFQVLLKSDATKEVIEGVFDFVRSGSHINILPVEQRIPYYAELMMSLKEDDAQLGELLLNCGVITQRELDDALATQKAQYKQNHDHTQRLGEILVEQQVVQQPLVNKALEKQAQIKDNKARETQSIRVDAERLDKLIDLIGELVISSAAASLRGAQTKDVALQEVNANVLSLVEEVRDHALQLRMVPIATTFSRFQRVVRDVSKELGKDIKLEISGGETEVDKSVVEKIGDPLMHLVRNSMDHGIENAQLRAERGKPAQGLLRLNAYHSSGSIVIEVIDDGGGLNREKILAKAVERDLVQPGAMLTDKEVFALIFEPGFSTADQVSNLSGRGVGMDVVKRNISELRGVINIDSVEGQGTTIRIHLPLTLAIIDGFLAGVGSTSYVIPLDRVVECVELPYADNRDHMELRGEVLPFIRLRQLFRKSDMPAKRQNVIVVEHLGVKAGLVVDRLMGELQTVIKPLGKLFSHVQGVGGSTILGSGEVALIIDVPTLLTHQERIEQKANMQLAKAS